MRLELAFAVLLPLAGCVAPEPEPVPVPVPVPVRSKFDRSFDAALGAATDAGVEVRSADRATGRIAGTKAGGEVTIDLVRQPDGTVKVEFNAPGSTETNPKLSERWLQAYQRRMGR
jgi:hypothetical protein